MPWFTGTKNRVLSIITTVYKNRDVHEIVDHLVINSEIIKRDFSKRQQKIILFIKMLSFPFGKTWAVIPNMQDFELCGINKTVVNEELKKLVELNVLSWDKVGNRFSIREPHGWLVSYHTGYNDARAGDVFTLNLNDALDEIDRKKQE
jgi:hypothetical protein